MNDRRVNFWKGADNSQHRHRQSRFPFGKRSRLSVQWSRNSSTSIISYSHFQSDTGPIQADTYEVLVPAFQPTRYRISDCDRISHIPRMHRSVPAVDLPAPVRIPGVERLE